MHARPGPFLSSRREPRAHRVERDIAQGCEQVRLVHRHAAEPALPEVAGALLASMDPPGIGAVDLGERGAQGIDMVGHHDQVDVVGHQDPAPHRHPVCGAVNLEQVAVSGIIRIAEEGLLSPVATLGDVVGNVGQDKAGKPGHGGSVARKWRDVNLVHCHRNCVIAA